MKLGARKRPHGTLRQGQVVSFGGPGAMVDLPDYSVIIGGLDTWKGYLDTPIHEPRLVEKIEGLLGVTGLKLYAPPPAPQEPNAPAAGIGAFQFPEWFTAQYEERRPDGARARPLVHLKTLTDGKFLRERKKYGVVPVRFVMACPNGHISDLEWKVFVHEGQTACPRQLWLEERGTSGDLADLIVRCDCGKQRSLSQAKRIPNSLGACRGPRPWLGAQAGEKCQKADSSPEMMRFLIRSATNAYFGQQLSVISIPEHGDRVRKAVDKVWEDYLRYAESPADVAKERKKQKVYSALEGLIDAEVWEEVSRRHAGREAPRRPIKVEELETLMSAPALLGEDVPDGDFYARALPLNPQRSPLMQKVERIVLVHRLREVTALVGFTRFEAAQTDTDGELELDVRRAVLARDPIWFPAVENRGEGVFVAFNQAALREWLVRPAVAMRTVQLHLGFERWKAQHPNAMFEMPDVRYLLLHSLSHLLITAVSIEAGYHASSIRERVYVGNAGCGILLHTGSPDAEGTLGGLVEIGRRLEYHLRTALELGRLCSNDPVCAQHVPDNEHEERFLLGAACHGCVLIGETSCERRNEFLDRALVVPTVENLDAEFFRADEL